MPHHNFNPTVNKIEMDIWKKLEDANRKASAELGATGRFPQGKLTPDDEGELSYAVAIFKNRVVFDFGKPIRSLGLTADDAEGLGKLLIEKAGQIRKGRRPE